MKARAAFTRPLIGEVPLWQLLLLYLPVGALLLAGLLFGLILLEDVSPIGIGWSWLFWAVLASLYLVLSVIAVWRSARRSHPLARYPAQIAAVLVPLWVLSVILMPHGHSYGPRAKILEGVNLSTPARTTLGIACIEKALRSGMTHDELSLAPPGEFQGNYVHSVQAIVDDERTGRVIVTTKEITSDEWFASDPAVPDGATLVYTGTCSEAGMTWSVDGTVPKKYQPKI